MTDTWDEYVKHAQEYFDSGRLETEEIAYKREMGEDLAAARRAVLASAANWPDLLSPNPPIHTGGRREDSGRV